MMVRGPHRQVNEYADEMRRKNKKEADINSACKLFTQIQKVIESKQLGPTVRTQYMRTAFQIPFDSSVSAYFPICISPGVPSGAHQLR